MGAIDLLVYATGMQAHRRDVVINCRFTSGVHSFTLHRGVSMAVYGNNAHLVREGSKWFDVLEPPRTSA